MSKSGAEIHAQKNEPILIQELARFYYIINQEYTTNWRGDLPYIKR